MLDWLAGLLAVAAVAGLIYQLAATALVLRFAQTAAPAPAARPPISVLKPVHGDEPGLEDNLRSLCRQGYPQFQIVCGALDEADPALEVARGVRAEFPSVDMEVVFAGPEVQPAANAKVASLENLMRHAKHAIVALADGDVRHGPNYLDDLAAALETPGAGIATCLYVARPDQGIWSRIEALWIDHGFLPSVLVARAVGRRDGCFGATIALAKDTLERAGGLAPLRDLLADDFALGAAVRKLGLEIALAARPVEIVVRQPTFASLFAHELRWNRTIAALDRAGHAAAVITQPAMLALIAALLDGFGSLTGAVLALAVALRLVSVRLQARALGTDRERLGLLAARELLTFAVFVATYLGRAVQWRGRHFRVRRDGTLEPMDRSAR